jgi:hypothetical protein
MTNLEYLDAIAEDSKADAYAAVKAVYDAAKADVYASAYVAHRAALKKTRKENSND